jgi:ERF superfamily
MSEAKPVGLYQKLAGIKADMRRIPKNGTMNAGSFSYKYALDADIVEHVREACGSVGIDAACSVVEMTFERFEVKRRDREVLVTRATAKVALVLTDGESGISATHYGIDIADDDGDKAAKKAATGARKVAHLLAFDLATGDDPDDNNRQNDAPGKAQQPEATEAKKVDTSEQEAVLREIFELRGWKLGDAAAIRTACNAITAVVDGEKATPRARLFNFTADELRKYLADAKREQDKAPAADCSDVQKGQILALINAGVINPMSFDELDALTGPQAQRLIDAAKVSSK